MKEQKKTLVTASPKSRKRGLWIGSGILATVLLIVAVAFYWSTRNYAQDASAPLERVLVQGGAVKVCGSGDLGHGPDNYMPHYTSLYELNASKEEAVKLATKAATENGFKLTQGDSPYTYIDWYWDTLGKKSNYPGFSDGNVTVRFNIYGAGERKLYCNRQPLQSDETHTAISLEVRLPDSK